MSEVTKGILLAGGKGTRLHPLTALVNKQLQPVYNKPMIYYPLTTLLLAGLRDFLIISSPEHLPHFEQLFGDGDQWGLSIHYAEQAEPKGIAEALVIGADCGFLGTDDAVTLMLGDNLVVGPLDFLRAAVLDTGEGATIFAHQVGNPSAYGVVEFGPNHLATSLEEKPAKPRSRWAVPGMYVYGPGVAARARLLQPSARGELEITDLNRTYMDEGRLRVRPMGRGIAWFDTGTPRDLLAASNFVQALEDRQGLILGSPEEAAYRQGLLDLDGFRSVVDALPDSSYRAYLAGICQEALDGPP